MPHLELLQILLPTSPLYDSTLLWVLTGIFAILVWLLLATYKQKGYTASSTTEIKNLNDTMKQYLVERHDHDDKVEGKIEDLDKKIDIVTLDVMKIQSQHDMVFKTHKIQ